MFVPVTEMGGDQGCERQRAAVGLVSVHEAHRDRRGDSNGPRCRDAVNGRFTGRAGPEFGTSLQGGCCCRHRYAATPSTSRGSTFADVILSPVEFEKPARSARLTVETDDLCALDAARRRTRDLDAVATELLSDVENALGAREQLVDRFADTQLRYAD